ncbi:MAG: CO dehydrogenase/CO-methylating acetyl-CoA synthase complex subunit beta [Candidatus Altiarchaeota archaeon]
MKIEYGVVYEGERIRGPDTYVELGGPKVEYKAELVQAIPEKDVKDGEVKIIGKDIKDLPEGGTLPFGILIEVCGKEIEKDLEPVIERRNHDFLNYIKGFMHLNQRYHIWCRISKELVKSGASFKDVGKALMELFKMEMPFIEKMQVTFITDEKEVEKFYKKALDVYKARDERVRGMKDEEVDDFYGCILCQSFAPNHVCMISPQRPSLCGALSWLDCRAAAKVEPDGPIFAIQKGEVLDAEKGEFAGVNESVVDRSNSKNERFYLYSMWEYPHTSCGCFEAIAFFIPEVNGVGIVDRGFKDETINGLKFSTMAGQTGAGEQTEGFQGFGLQWLHSEKFLSADGGWEKIAWMPSSLKDRFKESIPADLVDKIATEKDVSDINGLKDYLSGKGHPLLSGDAGGFEVTEQLKEELVDHIQAKDGEIYPDEASTALGITEDQLMKVIEALQKDGVLE